MSAPRSPLLRIIIICVYLPLVEYWWPSLRPKPIDAHYGSESVNISIVSNSSAFRKEAVIHSAKKNLVRLKRDLTLPGFKWCGPGNTADNYYDLGSAWEADRCCRAHDHCPRYIAAKTWDPRYNLYNEASYTRSSCECEEQFWECLHSADTFTADLVGYIYFHLLHTKCFRKDYPTTGCYREVGWFRIKCLAHKYNVYDKKKYQWFDVDQYFID